MALLSDLPVEIIVDILVTLSLTSFSSRDMLVLASTSKKLYSCFKDNERHIFLSIAKGMIPEGEGMVSMVINLGALHVIPADQRPKDTATIKQMMEWAYRSRNHDALIPPMFPKILAWLRLNGALEHFHRSFSERQFPFYTPPSIPWLIQHPFDVLWPTHIGKLPLNLRDAAFYTHLQCEMEKFFQHRRESDFSQEEITQGDPALQDRTLLGRLHGRPVCHILGCDHDPDRCKT